MDTTKLFFFAVSIILCANMLAEHESTTVMTASPTDLSSLARPQTLRYELRSVYLTQKIDSMTTGGSASVLVGEDFSTQRKTALTDENQLKVTISDKDSIRIEKFRQTKSHFGINGNATLQGGPKWGVSIGGEYGRTSSRTKNSVREHDVEQASERAIALVEGETQTEDQRIRKQRELIEGFSLGKYHLLFSVALINRDPDDTLVVEGDNMIARLVGPEGFPGPISVPYEERGNFRLGCGETICVFDKEISDKKQFEAILNLGNQGRLQLLGLAISGAEFPIISEKTGKNVLIEEAAIERTQPSTLVSVDFGELADLSPWRVGRRHSRETAQRGKPVTVREALQAVEDALCKQMDVLPERLFAFSEGGQLTNVIDHSLLGKDEDGNYRMFAVLLKNNNEKAEPHLPLSSVMKRAIKDYSSISLFDFTFNDFAQMAVLYPVYFSEMKKEIENWLLETGGKEANQSLEKELKERQQEEDNRELPENKDAITAADVERYTLRAEAGVASMQYKLAQCLFNGWGVESNHPLAVKWYRKAAEQGYALAQFSLGACYEDGEGVAQDYAEAVKWFRKAAEQGYALAQFSLGDCYRNGEGVTQDYAEAVKWYRKAAEQGNSGAQNTLGACYEDGKGVAQDSAEAVKWYRKAAEQGYTLAQKNMGWFYHNGKGVAQDYAEAVKWYRRAAEQGNSVAQNNLGVCYEEGTGVAQDYVEAVKWYRKAAEQGYALAQRNLGACYEAPKGVTRNCAEAVKWYRKAAEQGNASGQLCLGVCYAEGNGVAQDYAEAVKWFRRAAEQGNASAQINLAKCYITGDGVPLDLVEARKWLEKAAEQGDETAIKVLTGLEVGKKVVFPFGTFGINIPGINTPKD